MSSNGTAVSADADGAFEAVDRSTPHAPHGFLPIVNHGELAVLYCFAFLFIAASGSGVWSLDALIWKRAAA